MSNRKRHNVLLDGGGGSSQSSARGAAKKTNTNIRASKSTTSNGFSITTKQLKNRFPLFFSTMNLSQVDVEAATTRSDIWCMKLVEQILDYATGECSKPVTPGKHREVGGLNLGAMDAFPLVASRFIAHNFSVLSIRRRTCVELLSAVVRAMDVEQGLLTNPSADPFSSTNFRGTIFANLLSEYWEADTVGIFLHHRALFQTFCGISLTDLVVPHARDEYTLATGTEKVVVAAANEDGFEAAGTVDSGEDTKLFVELPQLPSKKGVKSLYFYADVAFPNIPVIAFDITVLPSVCLLCLPTSPLKTRAYLADRILEESSRQAQRAAEISSKLASKAAQEAAFLRGEEDFMTKTGPEEADPRVDKLGFKADGVVVISSYLVFYLLCLEYENFKKSQEGLSEADYTANKALKKLDTLYANDCAAQKELEMHLKNVNLEYSKCNNEITKLNKTIRRLDRKWKDGAASADEMQTLADLKVQEVEKQAELRSIGAKIKTLEAKAKGFTSESHNQWDTVLDPARVLDMERAKKELAQKKKKPDTLKANDGDQWRRGVQRIISGALVDRVKKLAISLQAKYAFESAFKSPAPLGMTEVETQPGPLVEDAEEPPRPEVEVAEETPFFVTTHIEEEAEEREVVTDPKVVPDQEVESSLLKADRAVEQVEEDVSGVIHEGVHGLLDGEKELGGESSESIAKKEDEEELARVLKILAEEERKTMVENMTESKIELARDLELGKLLDLTIDTKEVETVSQPEPEPEPEPISTTEPEPEPEPVPVLELDPELFDEPPEATEPAVTEKFPELRYIKEPEIELDPSVGSLFKAEIDLIGTYKPSETTGFPSSSEALIPRDGIDMIEDLLRKERSYFEFLGSRDLLRVSKASVLLEGREGEKELQVEKGKVDLYWDTLLSSARQENVLNRTREGYDPWDQLDEDPIRWLPRKTSAIVEKRHAINSERISWRLRTDSFRRLLNETKVCQFARSRHIQTSRGVIKGLRDHVVHNKIIAKKDHAVRTIQKNLRVLSRYYMYLQAIRENRLSERVGDEKYMQRLRAKKADYFKFLEKFAHRRSRDSGVHRHINERKVMATFFFWCQVLKITRDKRLELEKLQNRSAVYLQCMVRCSVARVRLRQERAQFRFVNNCRIFLAKKRALDRKTSRRMHAERSAYYLQKTRVERMAAELVRWKRVKTVQAGIEKMFSILSNKRTRRRFLHLKAITEAYMKKYRKSIMAIQRTMWMYHVKLTTLNYYKWRRGLRKLQGLVRRKLAQEDFYWILRDFRAAQCIQKIVRGRLIRQQFFDSRIRAIHYTAAINNYEKLNYLARAYPELLHELDRDGNTALHNAAKNASRRTLKLLMKMGVDPNVKNLAGYTALHLIVACKATNRDDCCLYMIDKGFDTDIRTPEGKTFLQLACENNRAPIVKKLLEVYGKNPNTQDNFGGTCLQAACSRGYLSIVRYLLAEGADTNLPGALGTLPLHDAVDSASLDIVHELISHGAYVNLKEPYNQQTPLMWACQAGVIEIVRCYLLQGADPHARDINNWTALHYSVFSNDSEVFDALREADADVDAVDFQGNSALHLAVQNNSVMYVKCLLEACAFPSIQNYDGNQPLHIAARGDNVECLDLICHYDTHLGRVNYSHQTPLGIAKTYGAQNVVNYFRKHYVYLEPQIERDADGNVWWDKEIDTVAGEWEVQADMDGNRVYTSSETLEVATQPPAVTAREVASAVSRHNKPTRRKVSLVAEENTITMHSYKLDYVDMTDDVERLMLLDASATCITKYARRKLAYMEAIQERRQNRVKIVLKRFIEKYADNMLVKINRKKSKGIILFQASVRGNLRRKEYFKPVVGEFQLRVLKRTKIRLARALKTLFRIFKRTKRNREARILQEVRSQADWAVVAKKAKRPYRILGVIEEFIYPDCALNIRFFRNNLTGLYTLEKPEKLVADDLDKQLSQEQLQVYGYTAKQARLAVKLQSLWRGYTTRNQHKIVAEALRVSLHAERVYLEQPDDDHHLWNYALHCFVVLQDMDRARRLFTEALGRMVNRGPDQALVLYSYAIFAYVSHDLDFSDVQDILQRARVAETVRESTMRAAHGMEESQAVAKGTYRYGKIFDISDIGFFRFQSVRQQNALAYHSYGVCRFLIYNDFAGSFDAFLEGFKYDAKDKKMKANFDLMMRYFHGSDKDVLAEIVRDRMRIHAKKDEEVNNLRQARYELGLKKIEKAKKIQKWYRAILFRINPPPVLSDDDLSDDDEL